MGEKVRRETGKRDSSLKHLCQLQTSLQMKMTEPRIVLSVIMLSSEGRRERGREGGKISSSEEYLAKGVAAIIDDYG